MSSRVGPAWAKDLVIYELNPAAFTSPDGAGADGSGSGTFDSAIERLDHIRDVGANAVWLAGCGLANDHFYGIWSVYAAVDPGVVDPRLGGPDAFRRFVLAAHERGIRVFCDVIAHGLVNESPLVAAHPDWFCGGSWGMRDYDYTDPGFRTWWKKTWTDYAIEGGVDGFRIDVSLVDFAIWDEIVADVAAAGREIVVFGETERFHFCQADNFVGQIDPVRQGEWLDSLTGRSGLQSVQISCHDNGWVSFAANHYATKGSRAVAAHGALLTPRIPVWMAGEEFAAAPHFLPSLTQGLYGDGEPGGWLYGSQIDWSQLDEQFHAAFLADWRRMLEIRRANIDVLHGDRSELVFVAVPSDVDDLVPFAVGRAGEAALVVLANSSTTKARDVRFRVPRGGLHFDDDARLVATDMVTGEPVPLDACDVAVVRIAPDLSPGGGYAAIRIDQA